MLSVWLRLFFGVQSSYAISEIVDFPFSGQGPLQEIVKIMGFYIELLP